MKFIAAVFFLIFLCPGLYAQSVFNPVKVAVVEARFDSVEDTLRKYKIPFTIIPERMLENAEDLYQFDLIFFPCGIGISPETSINILSRGTKFEGVTLKEEYYKTDDGKVTKAVRSFLAEGGIAVFNDYSIPLLARTTKRLKFYNDFPNIGLSGYYTSVATGDFENFLGRRQYGVNFPHAGWVVVSHSYSNDNFFSAEVNTPVGIKSAVISGKIPFEKGTAYFTAFHESNPMNELLRFLTIRAYSTNYVKKNLRYVGGWDMETYSILNDISLLEDFARTYKINKNSGNSTLFVFFSGGEWLVEVYSKDMNLLYSVENQGDILKLDLDSPDEEIIVKTVRLSEESGLVYSIIVGKGLRLFPYYKRATIWTVLIVLVLSYLFYMKKRRSLKSSSKTDDHNYL